MKTCLFKTTNHEQKSLTPFINSISKAQKVLKEQECPPLLYDIRTTNWDWNGPGGMPEWNDIETKRFIVFFEEEDFILFKLLYNNA